MTIQQLVNGIMGGQFDDKFREFYGSSERVIMKQRARYISAAEHFSRAYPECDDVKLFSSPVSISIDGERTYHQGGRIIAAAVTPDIIAVVATNEGEIIRIVSPDFPCCEIDVDGSLSTEEEKNLYVGIIREEAVAFAEKNVSVKGFNAYISSDIPDYGGFSTASAFRNLIAVIINNYYNNSAMSAEETAKISQYAETTCFDEDFGFIDRIAGAVGGLITAKIVKNSELLINTVAHDLSSSGHSICITAVSGGDSQKSGNNDEILRGTEEISEYFGRSFMSDVDEDEFYEELPKIRKRCSDTAVLSAIRFFEENRRTADEVKALEIGNTEEFFRLLNQSCKYPVSRKTSVAIAVSERFLGGSGAVRVCPNESIQAFVPSYMAADYAAEMDSIFGEESCRILGIRSKGTEEI